MKVMSNMRLVAVRRVFNSAVGNCRISKMSYHTDTAETLLSSVDTSSPDYKVQVHLIVILPAFQQASGQDYIIGTWLKCVTVYCM